MHTKQICITLRVEEPVGLDDAGIKTELFEEQPHFCEPLFKARIHFTDSGQFIDTNKRCVSLADSSHTRLRVSTQQSHNRYMTTNRKQTREKKLFSRSEWRALTASVCSTLRRHSEIRAVNKVFSFFIA